MLEKPAAASAEDLTPPAIVRPAEFFLADLATNVKPVGGGMWVSATTSSISYPEEGNDLYFQIEERSFWFLHRNRVLCEVLKRFPPGGCFFDIGGGNGFVSLAVQDAGSPVVLIEPGAKGAANALRRGISNVLCSTLDDAGFLPGSMPAAGAFDVLEHIPDDLAFLQSIERCLKPAGFLYLTVPAFSMLWSHEDVHAGHHRRYTAASLTRVLHAAGFEVCYLTYFFRFLPLPILLLRTLPYRLGLRSSPSTEDGRTAAEHSAPGGVLKKCFDAVLDRELALIRSGRKMRFGASCLAVARKR